MAGSRNKPSTESIPEAIAVCLERYANRGQSMVVGYSGGLDSTVLLHAVRDVAAHMAFELSALYVHHGLSANADLWAATCAQTCRELGVPLNVVRVDVPLGTGEGIEAAARRVRHAALAQHPADWILLAHHADDQAETVLHNLLRGAGVRGAAAMGVARGRALRPLLGLARDMLLDYAQRHELAWIEDESNTDDRYTRNFLRHAVLPLIASRFPRAGEQLVAAAARFGEADALLEDLAALDLGRHLPAFPMPLQLFRDLPEARAKNLLRSMLTRHGVQPPGQRRLSEFVRQLRCAGRDRHPRLDLAPYILWCEAGMLHFRRLE